MSLTPVTIEAIEGLLESARAQAQVDAVLHRKGWAHQYAQDVGDLLAEVERVRVAVAEGERRFADPERVVTSRDYADLLDALGGRQSASDGGSY